MSSALDGRWHPGIGDPSLAGWVTVAAYLGAAMLCYSARVRPPELPERRFWTLLGVLLLLLGINKQLDLQTWLTEVGRDMALAQGWYERRRIIQGIFIFWLGMAALGFRAWLGIRLRNLSPPARLAGKGVVLLGFFVLVRAASFHHVDVWLGVVLAHLRINVLLELGAISLIASAAWGRLRLRQVAG